MSKPFDLKKEIDHYTASITSEIMSASKKDQIRQEYAEHIEDSILQYLLLGMNEKEAFLQVCKQMGDPSKVRFLLADVHNNKIQSFFVNKIQHKLKKYFTSKDFFKKLFISGIAFLIIIIILVTHGDFLIPIIFEKLQARVRLFQDVFFQMQLLLFGSILVGLFAVIWFIKIAFSIVCYCLGRIRYYLVIGCFCILHGCKFNMTRLPFASLCGLSKKGDIKICAGGTVYRVHFIDVIFPYRREVVILNDKFYAVSKVLPDQLRTYGATLIDGESWFNLYVATNKGHSKGANRIKQIPEVETKEIHIVIVHQKPISTSIVRKNNMIDLNDGDTFGDFQCFLSKHFFGC